MYLILALCLFCVRQAIVFLFNIILDRNSVFIIRYIARLFVIQSSTKENKLVKHFKIKFRGLDVRQYLKIQSGPIFFAGILCFPSYLRNSCLTQKMWIQFNQRMLIFFIRSWVQELIGSVITTLPLPFKQTKIY